MFANHFIVYEIRSESFANDAQILKNLQEIKMQKFAHSGAGDVNNKCSGAIRSLSPGVQSNCNNSNKFTHVRKNGISLQKVEEYPNHESRNSSIETLPSSGTGKLKYCYQGKVIPNS